MKIYCWMALLAALPLAGALAPVDGCKGVLSLFDRYPLVALGERHGSRHDSDFRIRLVQHPDFSSKADLVVVEFANAFYQDLLDRYILEAEEVADRELAQIWRNTTQVQQVWESPVYREFLKAVRQVNLSLPRSERVRVVAGDPPINWDEVRKPEDLVPFMNRGGFAVERIRQEVIAKGKKALLIWGSGHFARGNLYDPGWGGITSGLSLHHRDELFVVLTISGNDAGSRAFAERLNLKNAPLFFNLMTSPVGDWTAHDFLKWGIRGKLSSMGDGLLFLGTERDQIVAPDAAAGWDAEFKEELKRRSALLSQLAARQR